MELTSTQIEAIQIDYGIIYKNFGETGEALIGPTRGGGEFSVTRNIRDIEYDGRKGKSKGTRVLDSVDAMLKITTLDTSMDMLAFALPYNSYVSSVITAETGDFGIIADAAYLINITMFAKLISGQYKKIILFNPMNDGDFMMKTNVKGEMEIGLEIAAHWDPTNDAVDLYQIEDVTSFVGDTTGPTVITVPADAATEVVITANLTATFNEAIKEADVHIGNFILIKVSDGSIVAGTLTYTSATFLVTFDPTASLDAATDYIWVISNVRDTPGNKMTQVVVNFTTAA